MRNIAQAHVRIYSLSSKRGNVHPKWNVWTCSTSWRWAPCLATATCLNINSKHDSPASRSLHAKPIARLLTIGGTSLTQNQMQLLMIIITTTGFTYHGVSYAATCKKSFFMNVRSWSPLAKEQFMKRSGPHETELRGSRHPSGKNGIPSGNEHISTCLRKSVPRAEPALQATDGSSCFTMQREVERCDLSGWDPVPLLK